MEAPTTDSWRSIAAPELAYRADIDGLRAVAVLSVVGFHASPQLITGGFIGVDIFFVISGYLISSLILSGLKKGTFSYLDFYARRIRRIFPALTIVLVFVWVLGFFALDPTSFAALGKHIAAGSAFAGNIVTYFEIGYFDVPANTKPLLHLWSLGVEEQFYLVFPLLMVLLWRRKHAYLILSIIAVSSFALNVFTVRHSTSFAFYLPLTRFWEFLAGVMLTHRETKSPAFTLEASSQKDNVISTMGILMILVGIFTVPPKGDFPGWWALLPVIGTVLVIAAGPGAWVNRRILADQKLVYVGLISYPLYLWHWPLIVIGHAIMSDYNPLNSYERTTTIVAVVASFILSWLTFEFVERPIRRQRLGVGLRRVATTCAGVLTMVALAGVVTFQTDGFPERYPKEIQSLLTPVTWDGYPVNGKAEHLQEKNNSAGPLLVAYGDSNAQHLAAGFILLQNERKFRFNLIQWHDCPPIDDIELKEIEGCRKQQISVDEELSTLKPDILVIGAAWWKYNHIERLSERLRFFRQIGVRKIIIFSAVPFWPRFPQSLLYAAMHADPQHRIPSRLSVFWPDSFKYDAMIKKIADQFGATFVYTRGILCNDEGCLVRTGDTASDITQPDRLHLSVAGSQYLVDHAADKIFSGSSGSPAPKK